MATINGSVGSDILDGSGDADQINGLGGNDVINGNGGNDNLNGGIGDDTVRGGDGDDRVSGGDPFSAGSDQVFGDGGTTRSRCTPRSRDWPTAAMAMIRSMHPEPPSCAAAPAMTVSGCRTSVRSRSMVARATMSSNRDRRLPLC